MNPEFEAHLKALKERRDYISRNYKPLHPNLYDLNEDIFVPSFVSAIHAGNENALRSILREEHDGIYSFDMLQTEFCEQLLEEVLWHISWLKKEKIDAPAPNSMNNYGAILDDFGFDPFLNRLMIQYVVPLSSLLFKDVGGGTLDRHHGFIVEYTMGNDEGLGFHSDDSEVTLNVCLTRQFTGGSLYFRGSSCHCLQCQQGPSMPDANIEIDHKQGRAVLIRGLQRHGANDITSGERYNLIMWCQSSQYRK